MQGLFLAPAAAGVWSTSETTPDFGRPVAPIFFCGNGAMPQLARARHSG